MSKYWKISVILGMFCYHDNVLCIHVPKKQEPVSKGNYVGNLTGESQKQR